MRLTFLELVDSAPSKYVSLHTKQTRHGKVIRITIETGLTSEKTKIESVLSIPHDKVILRYRGYSRFVTYAGQATVGRSGIPVTRYYFEYGLL